MTTAFSRNIRAIREANGMNQRELAEALEVSRATVNRWENLGVNAPRQSDVAARIGELFGVTEKDLYGISEGYYAKTYGLTGMAAAEPSNTYAPVMGNIAAGDPREAIEYSSERIWCPPEIKEHDEECFYLQVSGDSMDETEYKPGVYALISPNSEVHNGDIAAVKVNGDDATLKKYKYIDGAIILTPMSSNPEHKRRIIDETDPDSPYVRVLGKAVWVYMNPRW